MAKIATIQYLYFCHIKSADNYTVNVRFIQLNYIVTTTPYYNIVCNWEKKLIFCIKLHTSIIFCQVRRE